MWWAWHPVPLLCSLGSSLVMDGEVYSQLCRVCQSREWQVLDGHWYRGFCCLKDCFGLFTWQEVESLGFNICRKRRYALVLQVL